MKSISAILFAIAAMLAAVAISLSSPRAATSQCGIDSRCWKIVSNTCVPIPGGKCNDYNPNTIMDTCQMSGECKGIMTPSVSCTTDESCGDMLSLIRTMNNGVYLQLEPWYDLGCLKAYCRYNPVVARKYCTIIPDLGKLCNDYNSSSIRDVCRFDGTCRGNTPGTPFDSGECLGATVCQTALDCVAAIPIPPSAACLTPACSDHGICYRGFKPYGTPCGPHSETCDGSGTCVQCRSNSDCSHIPTNGCQNYTCVAGECTVHALQGVSCGLHSEKCDSNGDCVECASDADCSYIPISECQARRCASGVCTVIPLAGSRCGVHDGKCDSNGNCVACSSDSDCDHIPVTRCQTYSCASGTCTVVPRTGASCGMHSERCDSNGNCVACSSDSECDHIPVTQCQKYSCTSGTCTVIPQTGASCGVHSERCDSNGNCVECSGAADCDYIPISECQDHACDAGTCTVISHPGQPCGPSGWMCDADGNCAECAVDADCGNGTAPICQYNACIGGVCGYRNSPSGTPCAAGDCDGNGACAPCPNPYGCVPRAQCPGTCPLGSPASPGFTYFSNPYYPTYVHDSEVSPGCNATGCIDVQGQPTCVTGLLGNWEPCLFSLDSTLSGNCNSDGVCRPACTSDSSCGHAATGPRGDGTCMHYGCASGVCGMVPDPSGTHVCFPSYGCPVCDGAGGTRECDVDLDCELSEFPPVSSCSHLTCSNHMCVPTSYGPSVSCRVQGYQTAWCDGNFSCDYCKTNSDCGLQQSDPVLYTCPGTYNACLPDHSCGWIPNPAGTSCAVITGTPYQPTHGVCDGVGTDCQYCNVDGDCPGLPTNMLGCYQKRCTNHVCTPTREPVGSACLVVNPTKPQFCNSTGSCVDCTSDANCLIDPYRICSCAGSCVACVTTADCSMTLAQAKCNTVMCSDGDCILGPFPAGTACDGGYCSSAGFAKTMLSCDQSTGICHGTGSLLRASSCTYPCATDDDCPIPSGTDRRCTTTRCDLSVQGCWTNYFRDDMQACHYTNGVGDEFCDGCGHCSNTGPGQGGC